MEESRSRFRAHSAASSDGHHPGLYVVRVDARGDFDPAFGAYGVAVVPTVSGGALYDVEVMSDGRIIAVGYQLDGVSTQPSSPTSSSTWPPSHSCSSSRIAGALA